MHEVSKRVNSQISCMFQHMCLIWSDTCSFLVRKNALNFYHHTFFAALCFLYLLCIQFLAQLPAQSRIAACKVNTCWARTKHIYTATGAEETMSVVLDFAGPGWVLGSHTGGSPNAHTVLWAAPAHIPGGLGPAFPSPWMLFSDKWWSFLFHSFSNLGQL